MTLEIFDTVEQVKTRALMNSLELFDCEQNSEAWLQLHIGIPTASSFQFLMAKSADMKGRATYMRRKAAEILTGEIGESFSNGAMGRGKAMEPEARETYALITSAEPKLIGFARDLDKGAGCSPDALIGTDGVLEIKTQRADLLIETIIKDEFPSEHYAQCQGALFVMGRAWCDIVVYWPKMPIFIKRTYRDVAYCAELAKRIREFNSDLAEMVERVRSLPSC
jgi:YqaJ-like viral recombinase domain